MSLTHRTLFRILGLSALLAVLAVPASAQYSFGITGKTSGMTSLGLNGAPISLVPPPAYFDMSADLVSANVFDGIGYVWEYKVTGAGQTNRGLSHWVLGMCADLLDEVDMSFFDYNDPKYYWQSANPNGLQARYEVELKTLANPDPTTGQHGIKYDHVSGTQIENAGDMDFFKFRLRNQASVGVINWAGKGATILDNGTVLGPSCEPTGEIPEPTTLLMLALGLGGGALARRRRS